MIKRAKLKDVFNLLEMTPSFLPKEHKLFNRLLHRRFFFLIVNFVIAIFFKV